MKINGHRKLKVSHREAVNKQITNKMKISIYTYIEFNLFIQSSQ